MRHPLAMTNNILCKPQADHLGSMNIVRPVPGQRTPPIRTMARSAMIIPSFVGLRFQVHNGKTYHDVTITEDMVGHKLGEFAPYVSGRDIPGKSMGVVGS